ncbi:MAG: TetR/AcrR family transcriptional regulator [Planctomycetia bacterium]|nr:TetR/AcrR family transcriptional regulator [Planctomycetia bacterium]
MGKRQDEALKTRQKLIEAVNALVEEKGYNEIRIEEITEKAEVAKGTFYVYFKRKEDLIAAATFEKFDIFKRESLEVSGGIEVQIAYFLKRSTELIEEGSLARAQQWLRSGVAPLEEDSIVAAKLKYDREFIEECICRAVEMSKLRKSTPVEKLAVQIVSQYYGSLCLWCISNGKISMQRLIDDFCSMHLPKFFEKYKSHKSQKNKEKTG